MCMITIGMVCMIGKKYAILFEWMTDKILSLSYKLTDWIEKKRFEKGLPMHRTVVISDEDSQERYMYHIR